MAFDTKVEDILKKCNSIENIKELDDEEKELLRYQAAKNYRLQSKNRFFGMHRGE